MKVPFFDLSRQTQKLRGEVVEAVMGVVDSQMFIQGPAVRAFEAEAAEALSAGHAIGVASGSDAVLLALMALGVAPGDEVIVPAFSFFATASAVSRLGARIVFADIDPVSLQIDPADLARRISPRTRAVVVAHLFGDCADLTRVGDALGPHRVPLVEDAAQAFGAQHRQRYAGTFGLAGCFSFYPTKNLAAFGDGGMLVTPDPGVAARLRVLSEHGMKTRYTHELPGINSRLDAIQAAVLSVKLRHVSGWNARRQAIARRYSDALADVVQVPRPSPQNTPVYHQYVIRTPRRDALRSHLLDRGIGTEIYYPIPLHLQPGLAPWCGKAGDHPNAEAAAGTCLALPVYPELEDAEIDYVIDRILEFD